jgi:hypothetical protein
VGADDPLGVVVEVEVVVGAGVGGGPDGSSAGPKNGSRAKSMNPRMDRGEVSGRQSQRPPWSK